MHGSEKVMTPSEEVLFWKQKARQLEAKVQDLEAENRTLRQRIGAGRVVPSGGHGRENVGFHRPRGRNETCHTPEPPQRTTYAADEGRGHGNPQGSRPPPPPPSQRLRRSDVNEITFQIETPQSRPPSRPVTQRVDKFLGDGPKTNKNWEERRQDIGLSDPKSAIQIFFQLISCTDFSPTPSTKIGDSSSKAEAILQRYEGFIRILCQYRDRVRQITNFAILLHVCLCRVARITGKVPTSAINRYMNVVLEGQEKGADYLKKLRTSVLWPIYQAEGLRSWLGNRADEFFLLYGTPIETYRQLWDESPLNVNTREKNAEFIGKLKKICDFGAGQDCHVSFSVPFLVTLIGQGEYTLQEVNEALHTSMTKIEFEESVYQILSQLPGTSGFHHLPTRAQDPPSGQGDHESTERAPNDERIQPLIDEMYHLSSQSTSLLVPKPREASTEHPQQADPGQNGTVPLYDHSSDKVPDANYQGELGLRSDQTVAQPVQNQPVQNQPAGTGIAIMNGDLSIGSQVTVISQGASVPQFTPANGSSTIQVSRPEEATSEPQSRLDQDTRKKRHGSPPGRASKKRPRRRGNGTSQDGRTNFHPGDPLQIVPSPPPTQPQSRPNDQVYTLSHNNIASVGTDDRAEGTDLQETRMFTPINAGRDRGPATSLPGNILAASSSPRRELMGLIPSFQPSVRVHPPSSGATESFNNKQRRPEPTDCHPGPDRSGEPAGADWHADQSPGVTPLCTPAQSQVIASPESPAPMGEVMGNRFQADSHPALVRTSDGGSSQAEDVGEQQVTNSTALGDTQPPSVPAKARSGYGQARENQSDDDHSDSRSIEDQSDKSSEGQFDDETVEEAAPTRPRKRQRRYVSRGPPHLLPTPPASQSQTQPNRSTRTALHQSVPPSTHTVTDRSPDIQFTAKGPRDRSPLDRGRRRDNGAGLHRGDPVYVSSPLTLQTEGILALPALCGAVEEQLAALISFGSGHYPLDDFVQFRPGKMITGSILYKLLHLELQQFSNYALGVPPRKVTKTTADIIVWPENVNNNHWVIAIIDKKQKRFTSYGMTKEKMDECRGAYQEALGSLEAVSYPLQDYAGNTCAFRCCDALAAYLGTRSETIPDPVSLRLFYLRRLLQSRLQPDTVSVPTPQPTSNEADENESPGAEWHPGQLPGGTRLDTPAKSHAVDSPEDNPSPRGSGDNPSVAVSLELRLARDQEQNPLPGPNICFPDGRSLPVEHLTEVGIEQQTPLGEESVGHHTLSETSFSRLEILSQATGSPTTQFQTWPNDNVHTTENNSNLTFLGGALWRAGHEPEDGELASLPLGSQPLSDTQEDMVAATGGGLTNKPRLSAVQQVVPNATDNNFMGSSASGADPWSIEFVEDTGTITDRSWRGQQLVSSPAVEQVVPGVGQWNNDLGFPADNGHWFALDEEALYPVALDDAFSITGNLFSSPTP